VYILLTTLSVVLLQFLVLLIDNYVDRQRIKELQHYKKIKDAGEAGGNATKTGNGNGGDTKGGDVKAGNAEGGNGEGDGGEGGGWEFISGRGGGAGALYIYIYVYVHIERERERKREQYR